eukprot:CAMPEP_0177624846 /NCGR_PEP_ID=MMETSP0419_2-20121207/29737_1 /TAXON_ID=582737 /ORGANISM="Tetraselmis sp., Strain GSL018" /LENGTH=67 /DNA_ID=CAMNT_0019125659 /DNA_START=1149 /DNA_END=1350 /DNA_ORIENTATION=+
MSEWLVLGEGDILFGTGTSFSQTAANRTGIPLRRLPYKDYWGCEAVQAEDIENSKAAAEEGPGVGGE